MVELILTNAYVCVLITYSATGYQQSDAHEFLFAFLDTIRKNTRVHRKLAFDLGATVSQDYTEKQKNKVTAEDEKQAIEENGKL